MSGLPPQQSSRALFTYSPPLYLDYRPYWFGIGKPKCIYKGPEADLKRVVIAGVGLVWGCLILQSVLLHTPQMEISSPRLRAVAPGRLFLSAPASISK